MPVSCVVGVKGCEASLVNETTAMDPQTEPFLPAIFGQPKLLSEE